MAVSAFAYGGSAFIPFLVTMLSVMGPATLMSTDHAYGWDRLSLTLPVSRRDIVSSKFTVSLALNAALLLLGVVLTMVFSAVHRDACGKPARPACLRGSCSAADGHRI